MASSSVRTAEGRTPPPPPPGANGSNGRGKQRQAAAATAPAAVIDEEEDELDVAVDDSSPVFRADGGEDFFEWLSQFTSDDWQFMIAYLYRTAPTIDRRAAGRPTNLRKYGDAFDADRIMHDEGSGGYRVDVCRRDPAVGRYKRIAQHYFQIMNLDFPPRVPIGDWIEEAENDVWKWAKPKLEQAGMMAANPGADPNKVFDTVLSGIERLRGAGGNEGGSVAAAAITALSAMTTRMMDQQNRPPAENTAANMMLDFLKEQLADMRTELREMRVAAANVKPKGLLEEIKELLPAVNEIRGIFDMKGAARPAGTSMGDVLLEVVDKLADNAPLIYQMVRGPGGTPGDGSTAAQWNLNRLDPAAKQPAAAAPPAATAQNPAAAPGAPAPDATAAAGAPAADAHLPPEMKKRFMDIVNKYGRLIESVAPFLIDHFRVGLTGYEFRDWFISRQGLNNYGQFRADVTAEELTALAQLHQTLAAALQPPEKLLIFLTEFLTEPGTEPAGTVLPDGTIVGEAAPE